MADSQSLKLLKNIHDDMIVIKEFAKNTERRVDALEQNQREIRDKQIKTDIMVEKNDLWSKSKTVTLVVLSSACGFLLKAYFEYKAHLP